SAPGHTYRKGYYLADGIYPAWSTFVKTFSVARDEKTLKFKKVQEAARKDIERAFTDRRPFQHLWHIGRTKEQRLGNKAKRRWIKELCQKHRINFSSIQETKAGSISLLTIKDLWGNQMFDHVVGSLVGCSGELNERSDLWDYLRTIIDRWEGDTVIMGDFNEVRSNMKGDENSKYFHGIMNKKRSQLAIRGTLANGEWISEPHRVKNDFFHHFRSQFSYQAPSICFDFTFPTRLSSDQVQDLERLVTYEEVKSCLGLWHHPNQPGQMDFPLEFYRTDLKYHLRWYFGNPFREILYSGNLSAKNYSLFRGSLCLYIEFFPPKTTSEVDVIRPHDVISRSLSTHNDGTNSSRPKSRITQINLISQQLMAFNPFDIGKKDTVLVKALTRLKAGPSKSALQSFFFPVRTLYVVAYVFAQLFSGSGKSFGGMVHSGSGVAGLSLSGIGLNHVVVDTLGM
ncbi:RNA-directed DNA polymerase, eukaryota, partial [Tanacetum coccineum]